MLLKKKFHVLLLIVLFCLPGCSQDTMVLDSQLFIAVDPHMPFPVRITYSHGVLQPNHLSREAQEGIVRKSYDKWKQRYLVPVSAPTSKNQQYRITAGRTKRSKSFSEGLGYGMMLVVYMAGYDPNSQIIFDGLLRFVKDNPSNINTGLMAYQVPAPLNRRNSAFDGDADIAFALLLADKQWGSSGSVNYRKEAIKRIDALFNGVVGKDTFLPMLGDWVDPDGPKYDQFSVRSSDIIPTHFRLFGTVTSNPLWLRVVEQSQSVIDVIQKEFSPVSGLVPDFITGSSAGVWSFRPAKGNFLESRYDGQYFYNAARVPWRLGADALLFGDRTSLTQVRRMAEWVVNTKKFQPDDIGPGYYLNGKRLNNVSYLSKAFIGPFGVAAMTIGSGQKFINKTFDLCAKLQQDYYEDSIGLFCLLLLTGNCWLPQ